MFTIRISIIPEPSFGVDGTVVPVHVPIGTQIHVCTAPWNGCGVAVWIGTWNGLNSGNGVNNGKPARETAKTNVWLTLTH